MNPLKVVVVGCGNMGSSHARAYARIDGFALAGLVDHSVEKAKRLATEIGGCAVFQSLGDAIAAVQPDAASICTYPETHRDLTLQALDAGLHVFVEKPLALDLQQAGELVELARERGTLLQVGHIERFNPALLALESYRLEPMFVESHRLAQFNPRGTDVAVVLDLMIHDIDVIQSLVKSPVRSIEANGVAVVSRVGLEDVEHGFPGMPEYGDPLAAVTTIRQRL